MDPSLRIVTEVFNPIRSTYPACLIRRHFDIAETFDE